MTAAMDRYMAEHLPYPCSYCGAKAGEPCRIVGPVRRYHNATSRHAGEVAEWPHLPRRVLRRRYARAP